MKDSRLVLNKVLILKCCCINKPLILKNIVCINMHTISAKHVTHM